VTSADSSAPAAALALGLPAFPCSANKSPAIPGPGGHNHATAEPVALRELWRRHPGRLVGVVTGAASGLDVLDIDDTRHPEAGVWWAAHRDQLPLSRTHQSRSGGRHVVFLYEAGLRCSASRIAPGVDVRAGGGFVIWWPATGLPVLCDAPPAPWPAWLLAELTSRLPAPVAWLSQSDTSGYRMGSRYSDTALRNAARRVARAPIGARNRTLNSEAFCVARLVERGLLHAQEVADALAAAGVAAGLAPREISATLRSAFRARGLL
jgi:hypothetical protein